MVGEKGMMAWSCAETRSSMASSSHDSAGRLSMFYPIPMTFQLFLLGLGRRRPLWTLGQCSPHSSLAALSPSRAPSDPPRSGSMKFQPRSVLGLGSYKYSRRSSCLHEALLQDLSNTTANAARKLGDSAGNVPVATISGFFLSAGIWTSRIHAAIDCD